VSVLDRATSSSPAHCYSSLSSQRSTLIPSLPVLSPSMLSLCPPLPHCLHYPPLPPTILLPLCASILFLKSPFIQDQKYFVPVSGVFFCRLPGGLSPFCSAVFLAACLVLLYLQCFSSISHQQYSGCQKTCRNVF